MSESSIKNIRNGVIASVVAGIILLLIPTVRGYAASALDWVWSGVKWLWNSLFESYSFSGWFLLVIFVLAIIGFLTIFFAIKSNFDVPEHSDYKEDSIFNIKWCWSWSGHEITNLWCFCPSCDATLVYDDSSKNSFYEPTVTHFICENCSNTVKGTITGGAKSYALGAVRREIGRRIRTGEYEH
ncbi:hypothetical protein [Shewanella nanhaiensis]|uniref:Uncharacterized protein n=1 Tax=Shewanella nanhaiensis TaxID=2864872 RepID=A0ABS7DX72_9GAMM|nr:hypothetical protein [Shewanella nanhaiensis]MBW8182039.1 hypothetical protein [Shewanella nanhaiensis]